MNNIPTASSMRPSLPASPYSGVSNYTYDTDPNADLVDYNLRRRRIISAVNKAINENELVNYTNKEVVVPQKGIMGKLKLGFNYIDAKYNGGK
jgi:hypothetical protein